MPARFDAEQKQQIDQIVAGRLTRERRQHERELRILRAEIERLQRQRLGARLARWWHRIANTFGGTS